MNQTSQADGIDIDVWCSHYIMPPEPFYGGADGEECDYVEIIAIDRQEWDDGHCMIICPECGAELWQEYNMELPNENNTS